MVRRALLILKGFQTMAKGKKCPDCGHPMYAEREDHQPMGTWVYYKCRSGTCKCTEKVFETKR